MSDLVERLRRPITATYQPGFLPVASIAEEANRQRFEAASRISQQDAELERLQALYDREKAAHRISVDEAIADARKAAFIEAAEIALVFAGKHEPSYGLVNREIHEAILAVVGALRAKAEETGHE